ncbi:MAG: family 1 encapsulin nanocompartment shell protein [Acidimicrobiales bacterium]
MNHLLRSHAPVTDAGWALIDEEARERVAVGLAARRLVDVSDPRGWEASATNLGRTTAVSSSPAEGITARLRRVLAMVEVRADFTISREELRDAERGAADVELGALDAASRRIALAENVAVFHGWAEAGLVGTAEASPHDPVPLGDKFEAYPRQVARAVQVLKGEGISGPYGMALGPEGYTGVVETTEHGGYPLFDHLHKILGGPLVWAPGVKGAVVVSLRGGDLLMELGQDLSVGYDHHDAEDVHLYFEESFTFRAASPEAAIALP